MAIGVQECWPSNRVESFPVHFRGVPTGVITDDQPTEVPSVLAAGSRNLHIVSDRLPATAGNFRYAAQRENASLEAGGGAVPKSRLFPGATAVVLSHTARNRVGALPVVPRTGAAQDQNLWDGSSISRNGLSRAFRLPARCHRPAEPRQVAGGVRQGHRRRPGHRSDRGRGGFHLRGLPYRPVGIQRQGNPH